MADSSHHKNTATTFSNDNLAPLEISDDTERFLLDRNNQNMLRRKGLMSLSSWWCKLLVLLIFFLFLCGAIIVVAHTMGVVIVVQKSSPSLSVSEHKVLSIKNDDKNDDDNDDTNIPESQLQVEVLNGDTTLLDSCLDGKYTKRTLKLVYELPFASLFRDNKGQKKYEGSSVFADENGLFGYAICDSSWAVSRFSLKLEPFSLDNAQVGEPNRESKDSDYEAIFQDGGDSNKNVFYAVRESIKHKDKTYHAIIERLELNDDYTNYILQESCSCEFEFEGDSKGFEGAISVRAMDNEMIVLGLCEGNHCSEKKSKQRDKGHGRVILMRHSLLPDGSCQWSTIREINVPESAFFNDYSDIAMDATGRVAITSQEDSKLWVGQLLGQDGSGLWDLEKTMFDQEIGTVYDFPKNDNCQTIYCNVEGVHWLNSEMVLTVSDKMKGKGKQDFRCFRKDQSVHIFALP